jgi:prepilin-type N-terminal cleavage/methylation domain-containing protein
MPTRSSKRGFTLIEMSVVVILIALIVGGIIMARSLIRNAEIRSVLSDVEQIQSAIYGFKQKYDYLPGDFPRAESYWGADSACPIAVTNLVQKTATCNGNGDGRLDTVGWDGGGANPTASTFQQEPFRLWQHLANASLFRGTYTGVHGAAAKSRYGRVGINVPKSLKVKELGYAIMNFDGVQPAGGGLSDYWFDDRYYNVLFVGREDNVNSQYEPVLPFLSSIEAYGVDIKRDDGQPGTGVIRTFTNFNSSSSAFSQRLCATNSTTYSMNANPRSCSLIFVISNW